MAFNLLRLSIRERHRGWRSILGHSRSWLIVTTAIILLCQTKWFVSGARIPSVVGAAAPSADYGPAAWIYAFCFIAAIIVLITSSTRDLQRTAAAERAELGFVLIGGLFAV